ncbi:acyltransferase [Priestia megaterium]|uniref:acyltransferase n=1 Tax=Priestia megaterium TaxID=1404 RepID=UPI00399003CD
MKKYMRVIICVCYSYIKFFFIRIFNLNNFKFPLINIVSPFTQIEIGKNSRLDIGKEMRVRSGSKIRVRKNAIIKIGNKTSLNYNCIITAHEKICIGDNVQIGPNVLIYDHDHDYRKANGLKNLDYKTSPVEIGNDTWIGANVVILRGTKIGEGSVIAAGTIVKGNIPPQSLVYNEKELISKPIHRELR